MRTVPESSNSPKQVNIFLWLNAICEDGFRCIGINHIVVYRQMYAIEQARSGYKTERDSIIYK